jgi:hypothetical protein
MNWRDINKQDSFAAIVTFGILDCESMPTVKYSHTCNERMDGGFVSDDIYVDVKASERFLVNVFPPKTMSIRCTLTELMMNYKVMGIEDNSDRTHLIESNVVLDWLKRNDLVIVETLPYAERLRLHKRRIIGLERTLNLGGIDKGEVEYEISETRKFVEFFEAAIAEEERTKAFR